jgi:hypothetical protein
MGTWCSTSVQRLRNDGVTDQGFERDDRQGRLVRCFQNNRTSCARLLHLEPPGGADTPAIAGFQAGESELRQRRTQIVAKKPGDTKKLFVNHAADGMDAKVFGAGLAAAVSIEAGHRLAATDLQGLPEDISSPAFEAFRGGFRIWHPWDRELRSTSPLFLGFKEVSHV